MNNSSFHLYSHKYLGSRLFHKHTHRCLYHEEMKVNKNRHFQIFSLIDFLSISNGLGGVHFRGNQATNEIETTIIPGY